VKRVEASEGPEVVIKALGFHRGQIYEWLALYREGGIEALKSKKAKGREPNSAARSYRNFIRLSHQKIPSS